MTLILLAIVLTIVFSVLAYNLAIYALPFSVGLTAAQYTWAAGAGIVKSGFAAITAALMSLAVVIAVLGFAKNPIVRLIALAIFAVPAVIAGYAVVHGVAKHVIDSTIALNLLCGSAGLFIGSAAIVNLNALGESVLSR
ncbi:hypothetical protein [Mesorhizobium sp.]|uniref:hypothetical protein n=1 Tax=Mesorhizobium sp. TaxID=1871066 RepID=UPI0025CDF586|nr:hypothetical protein [Mesorhizobium sp.]